ncbi:GNAT family N-acetyltransferase [Burkholderia ubonensis]|uniref:GNAT family N-acetyltransferase n=1 Tax=Burkholderia ubonensis TaxID=101571 RepID=UPI0007561D8F|nr:GNAT family N-acetyltransferase [Burkholderia ubonensis]KVP79174.1 acetyltransferase [Burkholderia ubonensis]KVR54055.1 acetyltransferase [Burkholderia ubonensis]KVX23662.1 acetyltransferase [Burkholderia ubonensis]KWB59624.1 acetyltransferase [Burkholderia ubonensis]KWB63046.1 acetyltransferase [Burkholderia ubonensis]
MTITVRDAVAGDVPVLRELFLRSRRETFFWQPGDAFRLTDFDVQTKGERLRIAEDDSGRCAGFVSVWEPDHFIHHLYVDRSHHRRGVGRALLRAMPGWPATRYRLKWLRANEAALAFYRACRFTEIGAGAAEDGEYVLLESRGDDGECPSSISASVPHALFA